MEEQGGTPLKDDGPDVEEPDGPPLAPHERDWARVWQSPFLRSLSLIPDVSAACRVAHVGRTTVYATRDKDLEFRDAWREALELCRDLIQRTAHMWATTGVPVKSAKTRTVRKTDAAGNVIETTTETVETETSERSATMMIFWLKAWYPDRYRWAEKQEALVRIESLENIDAQIEELEQEASRITAAAAPPA
jgi:hypothetical protein